MLNQKSESKVITVKDFLATKNGDRHDSEEGLKKKAKKNPAPIPKERK